MVSRLHQYCHSCQTIIPFLRTEGRLCAPRLAIDLQSISTTPIYGSATLGRISAKVTTTNTNGQSVVARWAEEQIYLPHLDRGNAHDPIWTVDTQSTDTVDDSRAWIHCTSTRIAFLVPAMTRMRAPRRRQLHDPPRLLPTK